MNELFSINDPENRCLIQEITDRVRNPNLTDSVIINDMHQTIDTQPAEYIPVSYAIGKYESQARNLCRHKSTEEEDVELNIIQGENGVEALYYVNSNFAEPIGHTSSFSLWVTCPKDGEPELSLGLTGGSPEHISLRSQDAKTPKAMALLREIVRGIIAGVNFNSNWPEVVAQFDRANELPVQQQDLSY